MLKKFRLNIGNTKAQLFHLFNRMLNDQRLFRNWDHLGGVVRSLDVIDEALELDGLGGERQTGTFEDGDVRIHRRRSIRRLWMKQAIRKFKVRIHYSFGFRRFSNEIDNSKSKINVLVERWYKSNKTLFETFVDKKMFAVKS
jgi:hypothetical protein